MHVYLVQHGGAVPKDENPERPLSDQGREDVKRVASFLARSRIAARRVIHSGKMRALETALLLADVLGDSNLVEENADQLAPDAPVEPLVATINGWTEDTIVVGHLPFMSKLTSKLVTGNEDETVVHFTPGAVACLERGENGDGWTVQWFVRPELLGG